MAVRQAKELSVCEGCPIPRKDYRYIFSPVRADGTTSEFLNEWPMERPKDWIEFVNGSESESELDDLR
jgi:hypothetical protein